MTPKSDAVGRYTMNSDKALNFDIKMTVENKLRCQRSAGFFVMLFYWHATSAKASSIISSFTP